MASSIFEDKTKTPNDEMLSETLVDSYPIWQDFKSHLAMEHGQTTEEWKHYGQKSGWILKTYLKKRNLFFFIPAQDFFKITFVFGDKAVAAVEQSDLPSDIIDTLRNSRKYAEGRGIQIEVKSGADLEVIKKLVDIKIEN